MRTINIKNSTLNSIISTSKFTNSIENINSKITNININPQTNTTLTEFILNGSFNSKINIFSSLSLNLKENYSQTLPLIVSNPNNSPISLTLFGNIPSPSEDFNIICNSNTSIKVALSCVNTISNGKINLSLNSQNTLSNFSLMNFIPPTSITQNTLPINIIAPSRGNLNIFKPIDSIDFINSYKINLLLSTNVYISKTYNLSKYTLKSLIIWKDFLDILTQLINFKLPIYSILYSLNVANSIAKVNIEKNYLSSNNLTYSLNNLSPENLVHLSL